MMRLKADCPMSRPNSCTVSVALCRTVSAMPPSNRVLTARGISRLLVFPAAEEINRREDNDLDRQADHEELLMSCRFKSEEE